MSFENISKGEWSLPHFVAKKSKSDCGCGFLFAHECEEVVANIYYKKDDSTEESEHPELETAKANAEFICFCGNLQQRLDIGCYEEVFDALQSIVSLYRGSQNGTNKVIAQQLEEILNKAKR